MLPTEVEQSPDYQAMLVAAAGKPERSMGDSVIPAEPPDWKDVKRLAGSLLSDPPHLAVLVHQIKAAAHCDGFAGMHASFEQTREHLTAQWDAVHPLADPDDPDDPFYERVNLLREISEDPTFLQSLTAVNLVSARGIGEFSARDIDIANGVVQGSEDEQARCQDGLIRGAFQEADAQQLQQTHDGLVGLASTSAAIQSLFDQAAGSEHGLNFSAFTAATDRLLRKVQDYGATALQANAADVPDQPESDIAAAPGVPASAGDAPASPALSSAPPAAALSSLHDRDAVCGALNQIILYYRDFEPSSPVPIFAQRARDMVHKSFFDILQELAPAEKEDLPAVLNALTTNPLTFLIGDSYRRFMAGEMVFAGAESSPVSAPAVAETSADNEAVDIGDDAADAGDDVVAAGDGASVDDAGSQPAEADPDTGPAQAQAAASTSTIRPTAAAPLTTREQVLQQLGQIETFYAHNEPSSPIPLIVVEMRKLLPKKFTEIVAEFNSVLNPPEEVSE